MSVYSKLSNIITSIGNKFNSNLQKINNESNRQLSEFNRQLTEKIDKTNRQLSKLNKLLVQSNYVIQNRLNWSYNRELFEKIIPHLTPYLPKGAKYKRFGRNHDGGYVMVDCFDDVQSAYSFGINKDVSWDLDLAEKDIKVYQFDPTIQSLPQHHENFNFHKIGVYGGECYRLMPRGNYDYLSLSDIYMRYTPEDRNVVLKIDIEGYEYETFLSSFDILDRFSQIVVEFHFLTVPNWANMFCIIAEQLEKTHHLVHLHANNYSSNVVIVNNVCLANSMEFTYLRKDNWDFNKSALFYPTKYDYSNNPRKEEIILGTFY